MKAYQHILLLICALHSFNVLCQTSFKDVAGDIELNHVDTISIRSGGTTFVDFNDDGFDDLTLGTGSGDSIQFFLGNGCDLTKIPSLVDNIGDQKQVLWVDMDNDGDKDFFVSTFDDGIRIYENTGSLNLVNRSHGSGIDTSHILAYGCSFGDYNQDDLLDFYLSTLIAGSPISNRLYRNNGNFSFTDVTVSAGLYDTTMLSFVSSFIDINGDSFPDIYATTDKPSRPNRMYRNNQNGTFTDVSLATNTMLFMEAMSTTIDDYNADSFPDIYVTNTHPGNSLLHNLGNSQYVDTASGVGLSVNSFCWGANFLDGENDGDLDLFVATEENGQSSLSSSYYQNQGGSFTRIPISTMANDTAYSFSTSIGDHNADGLYDIVVNNLFQAPYLWENTSSSGNYLKVHLVGKKMNRDAVGSTIHLYSGGKYQSRIIVCGEGFLGQNSYHEIFGLGTDTIVDSLFVKWPGGYVASYYDLPVNTSIRIVEGIIPQAYVHLAAIGSFHPCSGDSILLTAPPGFTNYSWNTGDTSQSIYVDSSGSYTCIALMGLVASTNSIEVQFNDVEYNDFLSDTSLCPGEEIVIDLPIQGCYQWSDSSTQKDRVISSPGTYSLDIESFGCHYSDTMRVQYFTTPEIDLGEDTIICIPDTLTLSVNGIWNEYLWSDNSTDSILKVVQSGTYSVEVTDSNQCSMEDEINVLFVICDGVEEFNSNLDLNVFPNPIQRGNELNLTLKGAVIQRVELYNMEGRKMHQEEFRDQSRISIATDKLNPAVYFVRIKSNKGLTQKKIEVY